MTIQVRVKVDERLRTGTRSNERQRMTPSGDGARVMSTTLTTASTTRLARSLAHRNIKVGTPSTGAITTWLVKRTRALGRENLVKTSPVIIATSTMPTI